MRQPQQDTEEQGAQGDYPDIAQVLLNVFMGQGGHQEHRNTGQGQVHGHGAMLTVLLSLHRCQPGLSHLDQVGAKIDNYREKGAQVSRRVVHKALVRPAECLAAQDQVGRT